MNKEGQVIGAHHGGNELNGTYSFSHGLGVVIILIGVLIASYPVLPQVSAVGGFRLIVIFCELRAQPGVARKVHYDVTTRSSKDRSHFSGLLRNSQIEASKRKRAQEQTQHGAGHTDALAGGSTDLEWQRWHWA